MDQQALQQYWKYIVDKYRILQFHIDNTIDNIQYALNYEGSQESSNPHFQSATGLGRIGTTGFLLGVVGGIHLGFVILISLVSYTTQEEMSNICYALYHFSVYVTLLCIFHFGEFFITAIKQPGNLSYDSFVVNHSRNYTSAALASWIEFWVGSVVLGSSKRRYVFILIGLSMMIVGQALRTLAMWTCGSNFNHQIKDRLENEHRLVTTGIYSILRHPAYVGWFYWSIGTQVFLCNPICSVFYAWASWSFFNARIPYEEGVLLQTYHQQYAEYINRSYICIPFIKTANVNISSNGNMHTSVPQNES